jgi:small neutral amino acid transporter SnatA (MarC family)
LTKLSSDIQTDTAVFFFSKYIHGLLGKAGAKTFSKIAGLLPVSIAVMIVRKGIMTFIL